MDLVIHMFVQVLVELKAKQISKTFTYSVPRLMEQQIEVGKRVLVPFHHQQLEGFILKIENEFEGEYEVKDILSIHDDHPVLNSELLELGLYLSKKTLCNLIHAYQTMLPSALKAKKNINVSKKYQKYIIWENRNYHKNSLSKAGIQILTRMDAEEKVLKKELTSISVSALNTLIKRHILKEVEEEVYRMKSLIQEIDSKPTLSEEQKQVIQTITFGKFQPYLLHGVTGSGKTEVYLRLIEKVLEQKKEAIVLVPEISLTPQLIETFERRFGGEIAILHSGLSVGEKYDEWRKIEKKEVSIVIGARSAIFAPFTNLGIVIVDEEHSTTYKQENTPKYHAIDVALWRAKYYNIPIVLGSATPSIESYTRAKTGIYTLCEMKQRIKNHLPIVTLVDMKDEIRRGNRILSELLYEKIKRTLEKKEQVILLLNRRGYATISTCKNCGYTHKCKACDIPLTYHKLNQKLQCHYCGYAIPFYDRCPSCNSEGMQQYGMGTELLEQYLKEQFPNTSILRMDNDTTSKKGSHERMIQDFMSEKYQILIGTQMIAKGLNFPKVTLVGVVNGDSTLNIPDFRSAERTFDLLSQVAGRAGRSDLKGEVVIQGFHMDHYSIKYAKKHDYIGFYDEEMKIRKILNYSPYYNLCLISLRSSDDVKLIQEGQKIVNYWKRKSLENVIVLGPSFALIPKINHIYQVQVILKYKKMQEIYSSLQELQEMYRYQKEMQLDIDCNPLRL